MHLGVLSGFALCLAKHLYGQTDITILIGSDAQRKICLRVLGIELQNLLEHTKCNSDAPGVLVEERFFDEKRDVRAHSTTFRFGDLVTL
jgi:hypothetical protein